MRQRADQPLVPEYWVTCLMTVYLFRLFCRYGPQPRSVMDIYVPHTPQQVFQASAQPEMQASSVCGHCVHPGAGYPVALFCHGGVWATGVSPNLHTEGLQSRPSADPCHELEQSCRSVPGPCDWKDCVRGKGRKDASMCCTTLHEEEHNCRAPQVEVQPAHKSGRKASGPLADSVTSLSRSTMSCPAAERCYFICVAGEKWHYAPMATRLAQCGILTCVVSYTLFPQAQAQDMVAELSQALTWTLDNIGEVRWRLRPGDTPELGSCHAYRAPPCPDQMLT